MIRRSCALAALSLVILTGCGSQTAAELPLQTTVAAPSYSAQSAGLLPASSELSVRIVLSSHRVRPGTEMPAWIIVINRGPRVINITRGCQPDYLVVLSQDGRVPRVAFPAICSSAPLLLRLGSTQLSVSVSTSAMICNGGPDTPPCRAGGGMPALARGSYDAILVGSGLALPRASAGPVTLTR